VNAYAGGGIQTLIPILATG